MVGTIGFAGSKARQRNKTLRWFFRLGGNHAAGSVLSGAAIGLLSSTIGRFVQLQTGRPSIAVIGAVLIGLALADLLHVPILPISRSRQVPMSWKHVFPAPMSASLYGVVLGSGVLTAIYYWGFPAMLLSVAVVGEPLLGLAAGAAFGLARALPVVLSVLASSEFVLEEWSDSVREATLKHGGVLRSVSGVATAMVAVALASNLAGV